jgi:hypothetical protein
MGGVTNICTILVGKAAKKISPERPSFVFEDNINIIYWYIKNEFMTMWSGLVSPRIETGSVLL